MAYRAALGKPAMGVNTTSGKLCCLAAVVTGPVALDEGLLAAVVVLVVVDIGAGAGAAVAEGAAADANAVAGAVDAVGAAEVSEAVVAVVAVVAVLSTPDAVAVEAFVAVSPPSVGPVAAPPASPPAPSAAAGAAAFDFASPCFTYFLGIYGIFPALCSNSLP